MLVLLVLLLVVVGLWPDMMVEVEIEEEEKEKDCCCRRGSIDRCIRSMGCARIGVGNGLYGSICMFCESTLQSTLTGGMISCGVLAGLCIRVSDYLKRPRLQ